MNKYDFLREQFTDIIWGKKEIESDSPVAAFAKAYRDGNVEEAIRIYNEYGLDDADMLFAVGKGLPSRMTILQTLIRFERFEYDQIDPDLKASRLSILREVINTTKHINTTVMNNSGKGARHYDYTALQLACFSGDCDIIKMLLERDDIDLYHQSTYPIGLDTEYETAFSILVEHAARTRSSYIQPLLVLLNNGLDLSQKAKNPKGLTNSEFLKSYRKLILARAREELSGFDPEACRIEKPVEPTTPEPTNPWDLMEKYPKEPFLHRVFGIGKKYDAKVEDFNARFAEASKKYNAYIEERRQYAAALRDYEEREVRYTTAKAKYSAQQTTVRTFTAKLDKMFGPLETAQDNNGQGQE